MKKILPSFLCLVLLFSVIAFPASASGNQFNKTKCRNVVEFIELAVNRLTLCTESDDFNSKDCLNPFSGLITQYEDEYSVSSSVGMLSVSKDDNLINEALILCIGTSTSQEMIMRSTYSFWAALSALEFDASEDSLLDLKYKVGLSKTQNAMEEAYRILSEEISVKMEENLNTSTKKNNPILVYSGNYDYFLEFKDYNDSVLVSITARKR